MLYFIYLLFDITFFSILYLSYENLTKLITSYRAGTTEACLLYTSDAADE